MVARGEFETDDRRALRVPDDVAPQRRRPRARRRAAREDRRSSPPRTRRGSTARRTCSQGAGRRSPASSAPRSSTSSAPRAGTRSPSSSRTATGTARARARAARSLLAWHPEHTFVVARTPDGGRPWTALTSTAGAFLGRRRRHRARRSPARRHASSPPAASIKGTDRGRRRGSRASVDPPEDGDRPSSTSRTGRSTSTRRSSRTSQKQVRRQGLQVRRGHQRQRGVLRQGPPAARGRAARIGRDIVVLTDWMAARWIRLGYVEPLDKRNIPNAKNLQPTLQHPPFDPNREFTLPWQSGMTGDRLQPEEDRPQAQERQGPVRPEVQGPA